MTAIPPLNLRARTLATDAGPSEECPTNRLDEGHSKEAPASEHPRPTRTKHTYECLVERLKELEHALFRRFPAYAAECGLDAAKRAGLNYIRRAEAGDACDLDEGGAYLRVVAYRAARRCLKREPRTVPLRYEMLAAQDKQEDPTDENEAASDKYADLNAVVASLPPRERQAVTLRILEGMSLRKTAREMGIRPRSVSGYVKRALTRIRQNISDISLTRWRHGLKIVEREMR